jgi:hypothetical protein
MAQPRKPFGRSSCALNEHSLLGISAAYVVVGSHAWIATVSLDDWGQGAVELEVKLTIGREVKWKGQMEAILFSDVR